MFFRKITGSYLEETGFTAIHVPCARIPLANILTGQWQYSGLTSLFFCLLLAVSFLWFGPVFCGRLCPAGGFSEFLSKLLPEKYQINWSRNISVVPLRYGFFAGFLFSIILGLGVPCSYCNYYALEFFTGILHTGQVSGSLSLLLTFVLSNILLGLFTKGGRGYCNLLCPVGTMSSIFHVLGRHLPGTFSMQVNKMHCTGCGLCTRHCPMQAIALKSGQAEIDLHHCIVCGQCTYYCSKQAIGFISNLRTKEWDT